MRMALLLPKGIVVNSESIEGSIERIAAEPLDEAEIAKFWKVYTTTKRRLLDPTAERLENYWWRIWYSDKKYLDAATIARLFALISDGPTFVPLRGPPNRVEGHTPPNTIQHGPGASSTNALNQPQKDGPSTGSSTTASSSAASRAPVSMPHPILKKTRGPSSTGPRPTARFISPHESEHEADQTSSVSPNSHVVVQPPSPGPGDLKSDKKAVGTSNKKKPGFSASTKKKRSVVVRRQSSQTSQSSAEAAARESEAAHATATTQPSSGGTSNFLEQPRPKKQSRFQENFSPSSEKPASGSQSTKKRASRAGDSKRSSPRKSSSEKGRAETSNKSDDGPVLSGDPGPSSQLRCIKNQQDPVSEPTADELEELEMQRILLAEANARFQESPQRGTEQPPESTPEQLRVLHRSLRSKSAGNLESEGMDAIRLMQHDSKGIPSLAPTLADATGQVNLGDVGADEPRRPKTPTSPAKDVKGKGRDLEETKQADLFAKRPVEQVKAAPASELSRSKSQLTLLLKQDSDKKDRNKHESDKEHKRKK